MSSLISLNLGRPERPPEVRSSHPSNPSGRTLSLWGARATATGVQVSERTALSCLTVLACVQILAQASAMLPLKVYRRLDRGRGREPFTEHPLYHLLHEQPNPEMTSITFRETLMGHLCTWGNGYAEIEWSNAGYPKALWPLTPDRVTPIREQGVLAYLVSLPDGSQRVLDSSRVLHLKGLGWNGLMGYSPIDLARETIGLALATEEFGARFFGNGAVPGIVMTHPGEVTPGARKNIRESWNERHQGLASSHRLAILEEGVDIKTIGIPPNQAQFLETRQFQDRQIAKLYRIPLHMVQDMEKGSGFSSVEALGQEFVSYTLMPWLVRWEQESQRSLLLPRERTSVFVRHQVSALVRGDLQTRYEAYTKGRQWGWLSANDVRELEDMNPLPDGQGDLYMVPLNMIPADQVQHPDELDNDQDLDDSRSLDHRHAGHAKPPGTGHESRSAKARHRVASSFRKVFSDAAARIVRRERGDVSRAARRLLGSGDVDGFKAWIERFYSEHPDFVLRTMAGAASSLSEAMKGEAEDEAGQEVPADQIESFVTEYLEAFAARWCGSSKGQLLALLEPQPERQSSDTIEKRAEDAEDLEPSLEDLVEERLEEWEEKRPDKTARNETNRLANAITFTVFRLAGVRRLVWNTVNKNCPLCTGLHGRVVGIEKDFLPAGHVIDAPGRAPYTIKTPIRHPPLHQGCDCTISVG